jgi:hypothetical protein
LRGRPRRTTYLYDEDTGRITGAVEAPEWTEQDRAALLGLQQYELTLCPGCGNPKQTAWHADAKPMWEHEGFVCTPCTLRDGKERVYSFVYLDDDPGAPVKPEDLPELQLGVNTIEPTPGGGQ